MGGEHISERKKHHKRRLDSAAKGAMYFCAALTMTILASVLFYIFIRGISQMKWSFLVGKVSSLKGEYGILPGLINTIYIILLTLAISAPVGIGAAVYLTEYTSVQTAGKLRGAVRLIDFTIGTLAGIPSVVYGLFGAVFFGEALKLGYSILTGSLTLSLMTLPIIIRTSQEALKSVPQSYREGALGCGATQWYMLHSVVLPCAGKGLAASVLLAVGRITGESAALLFTAGAAVNLPRNWLTHPLSSGASLTVQMYLGVANGKYIDEAFGIALVLAVILLAIYFLSAVLTSDHHNQEG